jgi:formylglycine-generating enzyme required for sulfatase activity
MNRERRRGGVFTAPAILLTLAAVPLLLAPCWSPALAAAPEVTNVVAVQRPGTTIVDVTYDLNDPDGDAMTVGLHLSPDGGLTFPIQCVTVSGDVGEGVTNGTGRHIEWDAGADYPGHVGDDHVVKVIADDGLVLVQPGTFTMGSPIGELCRQAGETQHQVTLTHAVYISSTEVTQAQWQATMGWDESSFDGPDRPVEQVTWFDAVSYCNLRSTAEGRTPVYTITGASYNGNHITSANVTWNQNATGYRLLTEAEWQYACRAGSTSAFCNGGISQCGCGSEPNLGAVGWFCGNSDNQTHDVATKSPNAWGLYDMHGNVWEWCWDWYGSYGGTVTDPIGPPSGTYRVGLGGAWGYNAEHCRSAHRDYEYPGDLNRPLGLRVARTAS